MDDGYLEKNFTSTSSVGGRLLNGISGNGLGKEGGWGGGCEMVILVGEEKPR